MKLGDGKFRILLPPNLRGTTEICLSAALDKQVEKLMKFAAENLFIYADILHISNELADHLALTFAIRGYRTDFYLEQKRKLVQDALLNYARLGTAAAVENVVGTIHGGADIQENWEYDGLPYHFRITVDASQEYPPEKPIERLVETVTGYKNVRSWLDGVSVEMLGRRNIYTGAIGETGSFLLGCPSQEKEAIEAIGLYSAALGESNLRALGWPEQKRNIVKECNLLTKTMGVICPIAIGRPLQERDIMQKCGQKVVVRGMAGMNLWSDAQGAKTEER